MSEDIAKKIKDFFSHYKHQTYKKGEILVRADEEPTGIFYIENGNVREYAISANGDEIVLNIFKPSAFFPMSWALNHTPNAYFFEATSDVSVYRAPAEDVIKFIKDNPDVLFDLMSRVYRGTDGLLTRMMYLMSGNAYGRLIAELLIYAKRFGKGIEHVEIEISEKDLAAQSGMARETVSRELKLMKTKGLITHDTNKLIINNLHKLEEELAEEV